MGGGRPAFAVLLETRDAKDLQKVGTTFLTHNVKLIQAEMPCTTNVLGRQMPHMFCLGDKAPDPNSSPIICMRKV